ncbi:MAG TPA: Hint domain-containing protein [Gemmataceae bacterium]
MCPPLVLAAALAALAPAAAQAPEPEEVVVDISGGIEGRGLAMAECANPVYRFHLVARVKKNGEGSGTLTLDATPRPVDEFGFPAPADPMPPVRLDCSLRLIKSKKFQIGAPAQGVPPAQVEWRLFEVTGPKITSRLSLATEAGAGWSYARLLVADKDGKGRVAVHLHEPRPFPPCHPGCFPAGTAIATPGGSRPIDALRPGDVVTTVGPDGTAGRAKVALVFATRNRLVAVRTEKGTLLTTDTQPLALAGGGLKPAGELKAGDRVYTWDGRTRCAVAVRSVAGTGREERVFNLVLGEPVLFAAGGFLARSKPPATAGDVPLP